MPLSAAGFKQPYFNSQTSFIDFNMTTDQFDEQFTPYLKSLSTHALGLLCLNICKKLYFDYTKSLQTSSCPGSADDLLDAIMTIESFINGSESRDALADALLSLTTLKQHLVAFEIAQGWNEGCFELNCAYEACEAVDHSLSFLLDGDLSFVSEAALCLLNNICAGVKRTGELPDEDIDNHFLVEEIQLFLLGR